MDDETAAPSKAMGVTLKMRLDGDDVETLASLMCSASEKFDELDEIFDAIRACEFRVELVPVRR